MRSAVNFHHLQVFLSVAQEGSFSRAADSLRISQPAVSIQIRNLEESLGIKLFERLGRSIHLTAEGRVVLDYAKRLDSLVLNLQGDLENLTQLKAGRLIIGASRVPSTTTVPFAFALFKQKYPQTDIIVQTALSSEVERWVIENEIDLGIVGGSSGSDILFVESCYEEELVLVLPRKHPMAGRTRIYPRDILNEPILLPYVGRLTDYMLKAFEKKGLTIEKTVNLGSREAVKAALSAGYGVSIMPKSALELDANSFLVMKKLHGLELAYPVNIIYHKDKHLSRLALAFLEFLRRLKGKKLESR